jgi:hypothetical protein
LVTKGFVSRGKPCGWKTSTIHAMPVMNEDKTIKSHATTHRAQVVQNGIEAFRSFSRNLLECGAYPRAAFASVCMHITT